MRRSASPSEFPVTGTYASRFGYFFVEGLPGALGFRTVFTHEWVAGAIGVAAYVGVLGLARLVAAPVDGPAAAGGPSWAGPRSGCSPIRSSTRPSRS